MISNTTRSLLSLYLLFGDMKKLPSSFLFSSRTRVTVRYVKPAASRVFLHTYNFGYFVIGTCTGLPCAPYIANNAITCVVCTK